MQTEYLCNETLSCTCGPDPNVTLYNKESICFIERSEIPNSDTIYEGFIQLGMKFILFYKFFNTFGFSWNEGKAYSL